jgi:glucose-6-phosphate-specific signal transduction histidine kinase
MIYHFNIDSVIEFITAFAALVTILILWRYKKQPEVKFLMLLQLMVVIWAITYAFEFATTDFKQKNSLVAAFLSGHCLYPVCYFFLPYPSARRATMLPVKISFFR